MAVNAFRNRPEKFLHQRRNSTIPGLHLKLKTQKAAAPKHHRLRTKQREAVHTRTVTAQAGQVHVAAVTNAAADDAQVVNDIENSGVLDKRRAMARRLAIVSIPKSWTANVEETTFPSCQYARVARTCLIHTTHMLKVS